MKKKLSLPLSPVSEKIGLRTRKLILYGPIHYQFITKVLSYIQNLIKITELLV